MLLLLRLLQDSGKRRGGLSLHTGFQGSGYLPAQFMGPGRGPLWEEGATNLLHPPVAMVAAAGGGLRRKWARERPSAGPGTFGWDSPHRAEAKEGDKGIPQKVASSVAFLCRP